MQFKHKSRRQSKYSPVQAASNAVMTDSHSDLTAFGSYQYTSSPLQAKSQLSNTPSVDPILQRRPAYQNQTGLPDQLKAGIESLSGISMDQVRVHYNSSKPAQLRALAYAQGNEIHLASGQEQHLPHEAWHLVQQAQGRVKPTLQMQGGLPVNLDAGLEHEADHMGQRALNETPVYRQTRPFQMKSMSPVIQRYNPNEGEIGEKFWIKPPKATEWIQAELTEILEDQGCSFDVDGEEIFIANSKNISKDKPTSGGRDKHSMFMPNTYTDCLYPGCGKKFSSGIDLHNHMRLSHTFPKQDQYPYALFGGQGASSYVLTKKEEIQEPKNPRKRRMGWKKQSNMTLNSAKTGNELHSEWNSSQFLPRKKMKLNEKVEEIEEIDEVKKMEGLEESHEDHEHQEIDPSLITTDFSQFMNSSGYGSFFYTGEPHCGLCSQSMNVSKLPLIYPSNARPSQSPSYQVPNFAPNFNQMSKEFGGKENTKKTISVSF